MKRLFAILITICLLAGALSISTSAALLSELDAVPVGAVLRVSALKKTASDKLETQVLKDFASFQDGWNYAMEIAGDDDGIHDAAFQQSLRTVKALHGGKTPFYPRQTGGINVCHGAQIQSFDVAFADALHMSAAHVADADDTDTACKRSEKCSHLLCHKIVE